ncbi:unnamed protein product, partial [Didymodactylos carnosus]
MIDSIKEINQRTELGEIITKIMKDLIEGKFRPELDEIILKQEKLIDIPYTMDADIENSFDDKETLFREKVDECYERDTKSKSFEEKLINEYRDRLHYNIKVCKIQAIQKNTEIVQKRKIVSKIETSLKKLQNECEIKIIEWQNISNDSKTLKKEQTQLTEGNISNDNKTSKKEELKKYIETEKERTERTIIEEIKNNKENILKQLPNFVILQITSARGTMPTESIPFSLQQLENNV